MIIKKDNIWKKMKNVKMDFKRLYNIINWIMIKKCIIVVKKQLK